MNSTINDKKRKLHIVITILVMAIIFIHSALPGDLSGAESEFIARIIRSITGIQSEELTLIVRKVAHFMEFLILGICITINLNDYAHKAEPNHPEDPEGKSPSLMINFTKMWLIVCLLAIAYAATDELHQRYVPGRTCSLLDICIDAAGAALGALIMVLILKRQEDLGKSLDKELKNQ